MQLSSYGQQHSRQSSLRCLYLIVEKYGAALREMRLAIQLIYCIVLYFGCISVRVRVQFYFERAHYLFIYLIDVYIQFVY